LEGLKLLNKPAAKPTVTEDDGNKNKKPEKPENPKNPAK
jgi:hypothetical protein